MAETQTEKQNVLCYLEREREAWLPAHRRAERAGGNSAEANAEAAAGMARIDALLDELSGIALAHTLEVAYDDNV